MTNQKARLYFLDAIRAWAILMMLQGHFIDGLLDNAYRDNSNSVFVIWKYFRGITAPVFFTVSGFIFTYLLLKNPQTGLQNPRVKKGIRRGIELLIIAYLLRINFMGILAGKIYDSFYLVDVLHCIGLSLLVIIGIYIVSKIGKTWLFPTILISITFVLFIFEPAYKNNPFQMLPTFLANYLTKAHGSVFTIIPWLGYATCGGFMATLFLERQYYKEIYTHLILLSILMGSALIFFSSDVFYALFELTGIALFGAIFKNNYLFIRLGDVLLVFAAFMIMRKLLMHTIVLRIGKSTLYIYVIHFIILYGSFTGLGLYGFYHHSLSPTITIVGAVLFMISCTFFALLYEKHQGLLKKKGALLGKSFSIFIKKQLSKLLQLGKTILRLFGLIKN